jgi:hypothetical protein
VQGYLQQGVLNFLDGVYYIKISTYQTGKQGQEALLLIGRKLDEHLKQKNSFPHLLKFFPAHEKLPNTEQYIAQNFLGYSFLNNVYTTGYSDSVFFKAYIMEVASPEQVLTVISKFFSVLPKDAVKSDGENSYVIHDPHNGMIALVAQKNFLFGVLNCQNTQKEKMMLQEMSDTLPK